MKALFAITTEKDGAWTTKATLGTGTTTDAALDDARAKALAAAGTGASTRNVQFLGAVDIE